MPTPHTTRAEAERRVAAVNKCLSEGFRPPGTVGYGPGAVSKAATELGMSVSALQSSIGTIRRLYKIEPNWGLYKPAESPVARIEYGPDVDFHAAIKAALRRGTKSLPELSTLTGLPEAVCGAIIHDLTDKGANVRADGGSYSIEKEPPQAYTAENIPEYVGRKDNTFLFGAISDTHLGSKYERLDVLNWEYDRFAKAKVDRVFHAGNMIDGECRFNKFDIHTHGMDAQCQYLAKHYPIRKGLVTYAVSGDDHEGWYAQREGVDIGRYIENVMKEGGRSDWVNLGYMESHIKLVNPNTGKFAILAVVHPGGGSAYADSYTVQKIIECVPTDSEILTPLGWKKHNEVAVGDAVMGYDILTDRCIWTTITAIHHGTAPVTRHWNDQFDAICTANHRWAMEWESRAGPNPNSVVPKPYSRRDRLIQSIEESHARSRIIQAAIGPDGPGMPRLGPKEWLRRDQSVATVMKLTSGERRAFIEAMMLGEGTVSGSKVGRTLVFSQRPGPVNDAFRLACFLEGIATTDKTQPPGSFKPDGNPTQRVTMLQKRMRICDRLKTEDGGTMEVWCPTTPLGTWVMRQGKLITITGNSLEGGEKPAVGLYGHYHKLLAGSYRNVWWLQCGATKDQDTFARKKKLRYDIGGTIVELTQDPATGAIIGFTPKMMRYFNRGYYNDRWSLSGDVTLPPRTVV